jgi:hypothetical protein
MSRSPGHHLSVQMGKPAVTPQDEWIQGVHIQLLGKIRVAETQRLSWLDATLNPRPDPLGFPGGPPHADRFHIADAVEYNNKLSLHKGKMESIASLHCTALHCNENRNTPSSRLSMFASFEVVCLEERQT